MKTDALVVGGGLAGLTCAKGLRESGLSVVVAERLAERARRQIETAGGRILTGCEVTELILEQGAVAAEPLPRERLLAWELLDPP